MASSDTHSELIASPEVHTTMSEMTTKTAVRLFHPRSKE